MGINYSPKVGEILQCNLGVFKKDSTGSIDIKNYDGRIPPEMVKNRLVVVLNGRINNACMVVPLSSSFDQDKVSRNWHVHIESKLIIATSFWKPASRWAKADHITQVSVSRLSRVENSSHGIYLPRDVVTQIQEAVLRVIGGQSLLRTSETKTEKTLIV